MELPGIGDSAGAAGAQAVVVSDPIEPVNRAFFTFNDKLYFWVLKPVAKGYTKLLPQPLRIGVKNIYSNIRTPVRLVNCTLQGEFTGAWTELERFVLNTTVGVVGYGDPARDWWAIELHDADLGQTLGRYGVLEAAATGVWSAARLARESPARRGSSTMRRGNVFMTGPYSLFFVLPSAREPATAIFA
jgi:phospholipid-binding lipoprotein MlaA